MSEKLIYHNRLPRKTKLIGVPDRCSICQELCLETVRCDFGMNCDYFGSIGCTNCICMHCKEETQKSACMECEKYKEQDYNNKYNE